MIFIDFLRRAIAQGTTLLFGSTGEIITERSGNLNLGIPGIMYMGGISAVIGGFFYQNSLPKNARPDSFLAIFIPLICALLGSLIASLIYAFLTVTLRANQNVTGLALTTFGVGFGEFFGGSLIKVIGSDVPVISLNKLSKVYQKSPFGKGDGWFFKLFLSYGFLVYLAIVLAILATLFLYRTRYGLHLRSVGENPATADAAGIHVNRYKYLSICAGGMIAGLGGLYYVMDLGGGNWSSNALSDKGWLAIALVIFSIWNPDLSILGSYLFGGLYVLYNYIDHLPTRFIPLMKMLPYVVTVIILVIISVRRRRETLPPQSLGLPYFREER